MKQRTPVSVDKPLEHGFFGTGWNYGRILLKLSGDVASAVDIATLSNSLVRTLSEALESERVLLFLSDEAGQSYDLIASIGWPSEPARRSSLDPDNPLIQALLNSSRPVVTTDLEISSGHQQAIAPGGRRDSREAAVLLPLRVRGKLIGILDMALRRDQNAFSNEDLEFLSTVGNQAAIGIENARLHESLRRSQELIRRADRLSSLGQLTAGFAHEIRNTLVAIRTFTQLFPDRYMDSDFRDHFQSVALKEVDRICNLVNNLLSFARPSAPNVSAESVNEIVENTIRILETQARERGVQIFRRFSADLPAVLVDKEQIKQVSMNIILNALQSMDGGGFVEVSTGFFAKNGSASFVQIRVQDAGIGIPAKDLDNIFDPFFTSKDSGSGLGLSISRQIVQEHGGHIDVKSRVGVGTTFSINLPVKGPARQRDK